MEENCEISFNRIYDVYLKSGWNVKLFSLILKLALEVRVDKDKWKTKRQYNKLAFKKLKDQGLLELIKLEEGKVA